jgi:hypothetical protein
MYMSRPKRTRHNVLSDPLTRKILVEMFTRREQWVRGFSFRELSEFSGRKNIKMVYERLKLLEDAGLLQHPKKGRRYFLSTSGLSDQYNAAYLTLTLRHLEGFRGDETIWLPSGKAPKSREELGREVSYAFMAHEPRAPGAKYKSFRAVLRQMKADPETVRRLRNLLLFLDKTAKGVETLMDGLYPAGWSVVFNRFGKEPGFEFTDMPLLVSAALAKEAGRRLAVENAEFLTRPDAAYRILVLSRFTGGVSFGLPREPSEPSKQLT